MKNHSRLRLVLILIIVLQVSLLVSFVAGKYLFRTALKGTVTFQADLATEFLLRESTAERQGDGSYKLQAPYITDNRLLPQVYSLLPGLDVPKDPHVVISGKSPIPAYLFIEIVDETGNPAISFEVAGCWINTNMKNPKYGGTVYAYSTDGSTPAEITTDKIIYILRNNLVYVSQTLNSSEETNLMTIYAYLEEVPE